MPKSLAERVDGALRVAGRLVALAMATAALFFMLGVVLKPLFPDGLPRGTEGRQLYLILLIVALGVATVLMVALAEEGDWRRTGLDGKGWSPWAMAAGLGIGLAVQGGAALIGQLAGGTAALSWAWPTTSVLMLVLVGALVDAFMLRGYAIGLLAAEWGDVGAVAVTALVATLLALRAESPSPMLAIDAFMMASCLGILRLRTGSLAAALLAQVGAELVLEGLGTNPVPGVTAGLLAVVSFLLFRMRARTPMSNSR